MNIVGRIATRLGRGAKHDVLQGPVDWRPCKGGSSVTTKIDYARRIGQAVVVAGWSDGQAEYRLQVGGRRVATVRYGTFRPDVARYLGRQDANDLGFVLLAEGTGDGPLELECLDSDGGTAARFPVRCDSGGLSGEALRLMAPALERLQAAGLDVGSARSMGESAQLHDHAMFAVGNLDDARSSPASGGALASGWLVAMPGTEAWLEAPGKRRFPLDLAHRMYRPDIEAAVPAPLAGHGGQAGFLISLPEVAPGTPLRLVAVRNAEEVTVAGITCSSLGLDPLAAAQWLFALPTPLSELAGRIRTIDLPVLQGLIDARRRGWETAPVRVEASGILLARPRVSVIVPLYGRFDFVEHQLIEFARDRWLLENAEVIYVVDDRELVERMARESWTLQRLYGVPFRWLWGEANRGFAGANNLGAAHAVGDHLVFLNSDAIPLAPGWLQGLVDVLEADPSVGAVGPRLLYGDGSIQHAGMCFQRRPDLVIWVNQHPAMGLAPHLDPHSDLCDVPCVTGACMALRREAFEAVGGWDTGYLVGDFEDSDLCLKLRAAGMRVMYQPRVELTHLERQSFRLLGTGDFRTSVVIWNAVRHEERWGELIESLAAGEASACLQ